MDAQTIPPNCYLKLTEKSSDTIGLHGWSQSSQLLRARIHHQGDGDGEARDHGSGGRSRSSTARVVRSICCAVQPLRIAAVPASGLICNRVAK